MKTKIDYNETLRAFILKHISTADLYNSKTFLKRHFRNHVPASKYDKYIEHRCTQWRCDLNTGKRAPLLTLYDLEAAVEITGHSAGDILEASEYQKAKIEYMSEDFLKLLEMQVASLSLKSDFAGLTFPVCYDPRSATILIAVGEQNRHCNLDSSIISAASNTFHSPSPFGYYIVSLGDTVRRLNVIGSDDGMQPRKIGNIAKAVKNFNMACASEAKRETSRSVAQCLHRFVQTLNKSGSSKILSYLSSQKIFYAYYPELIKNEKNGLQKRSTLVYQIEVSRAALRAN